MGAVTGVLGGPFGGLIALGVGILLQFLFPQKVKGPRADSTKVSTAKYGDPIGRTHGTVRIAGAYVWLKGDQIEERKHTYRAGKGGPKVTEYQYFSTSACVFDWTGPVDAVPRMWMDDELCFDNTSSSLSSWLSGTPGTGIGAAKKAKFTIYTGTADQAPDARIVADKGADNVSAWRNMVYVVVEELNHEDLGIRLPNFEIEIARTATFDYQARTFVSDDFPSGYNSSYGVLIDEEQGVIVFHNYDLSGTYENFTFVHDLETGNFLWGQEITYDSGLYGIDGGMVSDHQGAIWFCDRIGQYQCYDIMSGARLAAYDFAHTHAAINSSNYNRHMVDDAGYTHAALFRGTTSGSSTVDFMYMPPGGGHVWVLGGSGQPGLDAHISTNSMALGIIGSGLTAKVAAYITSNYNFRQIYIQYDDLLAPVVTADAAVDVDTAHNSGLIGTLWYCALDDTVILRCDNKWLKFDPDDPATLIASYLVDLGFSASGVPSIAGVTNDGHIYYLDAVGADEYVVKLDVVNFVQKEKLGPINYPGVDNVVSTFAYFEGLQACLSRRSGVYTIDYLPTVVRGNIQLSAIIEAEAALVGLDVDTTAVTKTARGYAIKDDATPRGVIEDLCRIYGIDHCQVDGVYKFWERTNTSVLTVNEDHVGALLKSSGFPMDQVEELVADEIDLPNSITVNYLAFDASYRQGSQRIDMPLDSTESISEQAVSTNAALTDNEGAQAADVLLREARESQNVYTFSLPPYYARLHPGDVITIPLEGGQTLKVVIEEIEDDLVMKVKAHKRTIEYSSDAVGVATPDNTGTWLTRSKGFFVPLDTNMLRDNTADNDGGWYFGAYYRGVNEPDSLLVYRSLSNGDSYDQWATMTGWIGVGVMLDALPDVTSPYVIYYGATFDFAMYGGTPPASVTDTQFIDGGITVAVECSTGDWEIVLIKTITDNGNGTYTATDLVRGYRGTENFTGLHASGNRIVFLDSTFMGRSTDEQLNVLQKFVAVATNDEFDSSRAISFTNESHGLWPYCPVHITGSRDTGGTETLTVSWVRQSRYNYSWIDGTETVALNETSEGYEVELYEGATLRRTITGITSQSTTYTLAQYTTDAGGSPTVIPALTAIVYQISQELTLNNGRGHPGEAIV